MHPSGWEVWRGWTEEYLKRGPIILAPKIEVGACLVHPNCSVPLRQGNPFLKHEGTWARKISGSDRTPTQDGSVARKRAGSLPAVTQLARHP